VPEVVVGGVQAALEGQRGDGRARQALDVGQPVFEGALAERLELIVGDHHAASLSGGKQCMRLDSPANAALSRSSSDRSINGQTAPGSGFSPWLVCGRELLGRKGNPKLTGQNAPTLGIEGRLDNPSRFAPIQSFPIERVLADLDDGFGLDLLLLVGR